MKGLLAVECNYPFTEERGTVDSPVRQVVVAAMDAWAGLAGWPLQYQSRAPSPGRGEPRSLTAAGWDPPLCEVIG